MASVRKCDRYPRLGTAGGVPTGSLLLSKCYWVELNILHPAQYLVSRCSLSAIILLLLYILLSVRIWGLRPQSCSPSAGEEWKCMDFTLPVRHHITLRTSSFLAGQGLSITTRSAMDASDTAHPTLDHSSSFPRPHSGSSDNHHRIAANAPFSLSFPCELLPPVLRKQSQGLKVTL